MDKIKEWIHKPMLIDELIYVTIIQNFERLKQNTRNFSPPFIEQLELTYARPSRHEVNYD